MSLIKIDYVVDFQSLVNKKVPNNYYAIKIFYNEFFYQFKKYENSEDDQEFKFYRYQDIGKLPEYYFTIKIEDKILNFKVSKLGVWTPDFKF